MNTSQTNVEPIVRSNEDIWHEKLDEAMLYFETNNERPSLSSEHDSEKKLAHWIKEQLNSREYGKEMMASEDIRDIWDAFRRKYIEYLRSNAEIWIKNLDEVMSFFEKEKRPLSQESKDKKEKILALWIAGQSQDRENNQYLMATEGLRAVWDVFKNKYIEYLNVNGPYFT